MLWAAALIVNVSNKPPIFANLNRETYLDCSINPVI